MTLSEIDRLLEDWSNQRTAATNNLLALMSDITYKWVTGKGRSLTGVTKQRAEPVLGALEEMSVVFPLLTQVLDQARGLRGKLSTRPSAQELRPVEELLTGDSIKITTQIPFAERDLLSPTEK